jgi:hypothetical protein
VVRRVLAPADVTDVDGVPVMTVAAALRACRGRVMAERLRQGAREALERRLIDAETEAALQAEIGDDEPATAGAPATAMTA